jgi:hypothetical protein
MLSPVRLPAASYVYDVVVPESIDDVSCEAALYVPLAPVGNVVRFPLASRAYDFAEPDPGVSWVTWLWALYV